jgi:hypothetical protein
MEGLGQMKNPMTSSGIEPTTFRLLSLCLKKLGHNYYYYYYYYYILPRLDLGLSTPLPTAANKLEEIRGPEREADHSPPSRSRIRMVELCRHSLYVFTA